MITITDLKKKFGETTACDIPSLTINEGDILGLVGNNGAGKTTLFRMMLDLLKPDEGKVTVNDINPADSEDWKQHVSAYIDEGFLIDYLTPEEYFAFLARISNLPQDVMNQRLQKYERLSGGEVFGQNKLIRNLSAGNKQKVGIISALIRETDIVILDEPFNFLDPTSQNILKRVLKQYAADTHATIIISSHNLQHTIDISTRIVLLEKGQIINDLSTMQSEAKQQLEDYFRDKE